MAFLVAVAAEGADGGRVGVDALGFEQGVREFVGAGAVVRGGVADVDAGVGEGAGGVQDVGLDGDEGAVFLGADLHVVAEAVADEGAGEVFAAGGDPLDGAAGDVGGDPGDGLLDGDVGLVAEAAADFGDAHADHGGGLVVGVGEVVADDEGADGGGPGVDGAVFVEADDGAVGLDGGAGAVRIDEFAFDDHVGFGEALLDIAFLEAVGIGDVGAGDGAEAGEVPVVFGVVVDQDGVLGEGLAGVGIDGQGLVFDLDAFEGFDGVALGVGDDGGDVVADVADLLDGHGGDVADVVAVEGLAVAAGDDLDDAGHFFGGGGVDGEDFGVGEVGVEDGGVEEAGEADVVEVLGFADGFGDGVGAGEGFADVFEFGHGGLRAVLDLEWGRKIARGRGAGNREGGRSGRRRGSVLAGEPPGTVQLRMTRMARMERGAGEKTGISLEFGRRGNQSASFPRWRIEGDHSRTRVLLGSPAKRHHRKICRLFPRNSPVQISKKSPACHVLAVGHGFSDLLWAGVATRLLGSS